MKLLIAPDKLKGSLSAPDATAAIAQGARRASASVQIDGCPLADGGEGTLDALLAAAGGELRSAIVTGPLGDPVEAHWARLGDGSAVIEIARAAGLGLIPESRRDPLRATSYGVGELMRAALDAGAQRLVIGLGGSATSDGGAGMAQALGVRFAGAREPLRAVDLQSVTEIDRAGIDPRVRGVEIIAASDVDSPLLGEAGAARVFAPQKGASGADVIELEAALAKLTELTPDCDPTLPGAGAAGGLGFGLVAFGGARMQSGAELVLDAVRFDERVRRVDLLITGEGRLDAQSLRGKAAIAAARRAQKAGIVAIALVGQKTEAARDAHGEGLTASFAILDRPMPLELALTEARRLLADLAEEVVRLILAFR